jgi:hypothetical protein
MRNSLGAWPRRWKAVTGGWAAIPYLPPTSMPWRAERLRDGATSRRAVLRPGHGRWSGRFV